jgi:hypothetical protein
MIESNEPGSIPGSPAWARLQIASLALHPGSMRERSSPRFVSGAE